VQARTDDPVSRPGSPSSPAPSTSTATPRIYDSTDAEIAPPVTIFQRPPSRNWPTSVAATLSGIRASGVVSIVIDEKGDVADATIVESIHPVYDRLLLTSVRQWKYRPAVKAGVPVKYRKTLRIEVQ
jgi:TonB family protein